VREKGCVLRTNTNPVLISKPCVVRRRLGGGGRRGRGKKRGRGGSFPKYLCVHFEGGGEKRGGGKVHTLFLLCVAEVR